MKIACSVPRQRHMDSSRGLRATASHPRFGWIEKTARRVSGAESDPAIPRAADAARRGHAPSRPGVARSRSQPLAILPVPLTRHDLFGRLGERVLSRLSEAGLLIWTGVISDPQSPAVSAGDSRNAATARGARSFESPVRRPGDGGTEFRSPAARWSLHCKGGVAFHVRRGVAFPHPGPQVHFYGVQACRFDVRR